MFGAGLRDFNGDVRQGDGIVADAVYFIAKQETVFSFRPRMKFLQGPAFRGLFDGDDRVSLLFEDLQQAVGFFFVGPFD